MNTHKESRPSLTCFSICKSCIPLAIASLPVSNFSCVAISFLSSADMAAFWSSSFFLSLSLTVLRSRSVSVDAALCCACCGWAYCGCAYCPAA